MRRSWEGPRLDDDQQAVLDLVDDLVADRLARVGDDRPDDVDAARRSLAEQGLWTLGVAESDGGGGAGTATMLVALARLAGTWPALAWASVQAHAAALAGTGRVGELLPGLHEGAPVAVVAVDDGAVALSGGRISGVLPRIDPAGRAPRLVVLLDADTAVVVPPDGVGTATPVHRTGLDGALSVRVRLDAAVPEDLVLRGSQVRRAGALLHAGAAAVAAGIAEAAAATALAYSAGRVQFGAPLTELPTVRASLSAQAATARALLVSAIATDLERVDALASALLPACDAAIDVAAAAVQSHGGYGYMTEYAVEGLLRDAVSLRAASGAVEAARAAARSLVGADG